MEIKSVILAAGKGTRMKSNTPKVLHKIFEKPLLGYVLDNVKNIVNESFVIVGHHAEEVTEYVEKNYKTAKTVLQSPQLGTGHAVSMVCPALENFEGPLDLLCYLINKNKLDISEVKISEIADQYLAFITAQETMNLEVTSEFLIMASNLLLIKSKMLLPKEVDDEAELTEEELLNKIIEYKKYKEISIILKERYNENKNILFKSSLYV